MTSVEIRDSISQAAVEAERYIQASERLKAMIASDRLQVLAGLVELRREAIKHYRQDQEQFTPFHAPEITVANHLGLTQCIGEIEVMIDLVGDGEDNFGLAIRLLCRYPAVRTKFNLQ